MKEFFELLTKEEQKEMTDIFNRKEIRELLKPKSQWAQDLINNGSRNCFLCGGESYSCNGMC